MKKFYHISSEALEKNDIFHSREDFATGMNDIATCSLRYDVMILCFCLMSNHFHFVLKGTYKSCQSFMAEFKRITSMRMRTSRKSSGSSYHNDAILLRMVINICIFQGKS